MSVNLYLSVDHRRFSLCAVGGRDEVAEVGGWERASRGELLVAGRL